MDELKKRKISIVLKDPVDGKKNFDFVSESADLADQIALARDKAKTFPLSNIDGIYMSLCEDGKLLNMTNILIEQ